MKTLKYVLVVVFSSTFLISCGNKEEKKKAGFTYEKSSEQPITKPSEENNLQTVVISGNDQMQFDISEIKVQSGKKIKLTLRHKGKMGVNIMGHNFVLLKQGVNVAGFGRKAASAKDNQFIPKDAENDVIAFTKVIGGGETTSIEFDAPKPGTYDFICSFPGHYALMKGKFIVE
ncbi:azurin [Tamlana sp. 62-3]|uniref:Azurin n=1 Tax=Neotamlana sargassicola TaxID=2883125 RepID=A0A9X1L6I8_9FLAO|nr:azurin [Tamlana sargassicola]MCB4806703.1 azurin [Tamlana sargassicola]